MKVSKFCFYAFLIFNFSNSYSIKDLVSAIDNLDVNQFKKLYKETKKDLKQESKENLLKKVDEKIESLRKHNLSDQDLKKLFFSGLIFSLGLGTTVIGILTAKPGTQYYLKSKLASGTITVSGALVTFLGLHKSANVLRNSNSKNPENLKNAQKIKLLLAQNKKEKEHENN